MSKTLRTVAVIAGAVALVATGVGALAGAGIIGSSGIVVGGAGAGLLGAAGATVGAGVVAGVSAATFATVGAIASLAATVASIGAQLTAKKPPARGSINQVLIASDAPSPYVMGRTYIGGVLRHDVGYGPTLKKVPNPYRAMVLLLSVAGPVQSVEATYLDYASVSFSANAATGYYSTFLYRDIRLGVGSEAALTPSFAGVPGWSTAHKLSSKCAVMLNLKFDKDGKRFASGVPSIGHVVLGVKVYDPRLDSTYPGGSGSCRINDESTWLYSENPGLHALSYALGRYRVGKKVFGVGLPGEGIRITDFVTLANVCDANGWKVGGAIYEPGDRWSNLKEILQAGGAEPLFTGGKLGCKINAPRVSLDTVTAVDLADDDAETTPMQSWRNRRNGIIPKYRSEAHKWEYVPSDLVSVPAYVTEDGEEKIEERQYNLVQQKNQAAQLAAYELVNGRELFPITLVCKPRLRKFGPGDMLTLNLPTDHGLADVDAVIVDHSIDPATMKVTLTFMSETDGKHDFALGRTGTAPPTPSLTSPNDRDDIITAVDAPRYDDGTFIDDLKPAEPGATDGMNPAERDEFANMTADIEGIDTAIGVAIGQINDILTDLAGLEASIGTVTLDVGDLADRITAAEGDINTVQSTVATQSASITTNSTAISNLVGNLATLTTRVAAGSPQLLKNGGFVDGMTDWVGANWAFANDSSWGPRAVATANGTYTLEYAPRTAVVGATYTFAADTRMNAAGGTIYVDLQCLDAGGAVLIDGPQNPRSPVHEFDATTAGRGAIAASVTAPAGTVTIKPRIVVAGATGVVSIGVRLAKLERSATWSPYSSEASVAQAFTAISTIDTQVATLSTNLATANASISLNASAITTLQGSTASLSSTVSSQGASITTLQSTTSTQGGQIASLSSSLTTANANITSNASAISGLNSSVSSLSSTVTSQGASISSLTTAASTTAGDVAQINIRLRAGASNILPNGGFENGSSGWYGTGWTFGLSGGWGNIAALSNPANGTHVLASDFFPVFAGAQYTVAGDPLFFASGGAVYLDMLYFKGDGTPTDTGHDGTQSFQYPSFDFNYTDDRRALIAATSVAPPGAVKAQVRFVVEGGVGVTVAGVRRIKVEQAATWSPYSSEASVAQTFSALNTLNSQYASINTTVSVQGASVAVLQSAVSTLNGRTGAFWQVLAVAGTGRAQLTLYADANGGGGVDIVGNVRIKGIVQADSFITDQGVDLAAIVPGSLNTSVRADQSGSSSVPPRVFPDPPNLAVIAQTPVITIADVNEAIFINWGVTHSGLDGGGGAFIYMQISTDGVNWFTRQQLPIGVTASGGSYALSYEDIDHGTASYMVRLLVRNGTSTYAGNATTIDTSGGYIRLRRFFSK